jgi:hypothetical protein
MGVGGEELVGVYENTHMHDAMMNALFGSASASAPASSSASTTTSVDASRCPRARRRVWFAKRRVRPQTESTRSIRGWCRSRRAMREMQIRDPDGLRIVIVASLPRMLTCQLVLAFVSHLVRRGGAADARDRWIGVGDSAARPSCVVCENSGVSCLRG